jgi:hypothetical protein
MRREQLTEKIFDIKRARGWSWKHITTEIGGVSPVLIVGALLGQMKLVKPLAKKATALFGLSETEERMLNEVPNRGGHAHVESRVATDVYAPGSSRSRLLKQRLARGARQTTNYVCKSCHVLSPALRGKNGIGAPSSGRAEF